MSAHIAEGSSSVLTLLVQISLQNIHTDLARHVWLTIWEFQTLPYTNQYAMIYLNIYVYVCVCTYIVSHKLYSKYMRNTVSF